MSVYEKGLKSSGMHITVLNENVGLGLGFILLASE